MRNGRRGRCFSLLVVRSPHSSPASPSPLPSTRSVASSPLAPSAASSLAAPSRLSRTSSVPPSPKLMSRPSPPKSASSMSSSSSSWRSPSRRPSSGSLGDSPAGSLRASPAPLKEDAPPRRRPGALLACTTAGYPAGGAASPPAAGRPLRSARPARLAYSPARLRRRLPSRLCDRGPSKGECPQKCVSVTRPVLGRSNPFREPRGENEVTREGCGGLGWGTWWPGEAEIMTPKWKYRTDV